MYERNDLPQNQSALHWLKKAKAPINPDQPYLLQLLWWGMEDAHLQFPDQPNQGYSRRERLSQAVLDLLESRSPQKAVTYLTEQGSLSWENLELADSPQEAAKRALEALEAALDSDLPTTTVSE